MAKRKGRTLTEVYEQHANNERERQDYLKELQREEQSKDQDAAMEAAQRVVDEYKERRPSPPRGEVQEHSAIAPDSRLGFLRNNPGALPLVPLAPPQDLGRHPDATTYREQINPATGEFDTSNRKRR